MDGPAVRQPGQRTPAPGVQKVWSGHAPHTRVGRSHRFAVGWWRSGGLVRWCVGVLARWTCEPQADCAMGRVPSVLTLAHGSPGRVHWSHSLSCLSPQQRLSDIHAAHWPLESAPSLMKPAVVTLPLANPPQIPHPVLDLPPSCAPCRASLPLLLVACARSRAIPCMLHKKTKEQIGHYLVTPFPIATEGGGFVGAVSIRRGKYDRVFRFIPQFATESLASSYALSEGRSMVQSHRLN